ncbi:retrovirus-related pol polyprotein from transposon TNT 1-94 [Tanacetum coccineum]
MTKRRSKEAEMTRTAKVIENALDAVTQIILIENVQNYRRTRTNELSSEVLGVITVRKMMKRLKTKRVSWLTHLARIDLEPDEWIKVSSCSKHMTGNRKLFSTYKVYNGGNVVFGSNLHSNIIGKGQICDNKCKVIFSKIDSEIVKDGKVIGRGIRKRGLYVMKLGKKPEDKICLATIDENSTLWHRRLSHANMRLIQSLASKELVRNLPKLKFDQHFCDACKIRKQAHSSHKAKNLVSTTRCLELLHMDLFGPSAVQSYEGNLYTLVIVDDYSRAILGKLPYELLRGRKPNLDYFKVFGKPKNGNEALKYESWIIAMQEELNQFVENNVWELVSHPKSTTIIGTKWVYMNKLDENGVVSRNKARLVAQGYNQQEGIDYDETYASVARLESIRILLAYACALDFKLFQIDVRSAFLNGFINEEVYVAQPLGFTDFEKPNHVYKLKKDLYGLKQAPKACHHLNYASSSYAFNSSSSTHHIDGNDDENEEVTPRANTPSPSRYVNSLSNDVP